MPSSRRRSRSSKRRGISIFGKRSRSRRRRSSRGGSGRGSLFAKLAIAFAIFCSVATAGLYFIHTNVADLGYIDALLASYDPDFKVWQENIRSGSYGDLGRHDRRWKASRNLGYGRHQDALGDLFDEAVENVHYVILIFIGGGIAILVLLLSIK